MHMKKIEKGFTLLELLVVVALIGIMSAIVMASLSSARKGGEDTAISANLTKLQTQAELYHSTFNNYGSNTSEFSGPCPIVETDSSVSGLMGVSGVGALAFSKELVSRVGSANTVCVVAANGEKWAAASVLKGDSAEVACADSTGRFKISTVDLASAITASTCN